MDRWNGKVAVVTGASSGIGLATAKSLVQEGLIVIGLARRVSQMETEMNDVKGPGKFYAKECDITNKENVAKSFNWIKDNFGTVNILINNAGVVKLQTIEDVSNEDLEQIINVNVLGLLYCSKEAIKLMRANNTDAHIVNINSILGHKILNTSRINIYPATKYAVRAISETLVNELQNSKIRVTNVSPGLVKTEMFDNVSKIHKQLLENPALEAADIASSIIHVLGAPAHVEITEITILPRRI